DTTTHIKDLTLIVEESRTEVVALVGHDAMFINPTPMDATPAMSLMYCEGENTGVGWRGFGDTGWRSIFEELM
ncbi:MAG: hypothetical protein Q9228_007740, partial [Teloschistes exilis]